MQANLYDPNLFGCFGGIYVNLSKRYCNRFSSFFLCVRFLSLFPLAVFIGYRKL